MIKRVVLFVFLGVFALGCGTKKRTTASKGSQVSVRSTKSKVPDENGLYPLPEDTGKFVRFPISSIEEYIDTFSEIAQFEMKAYGIPASITLAQGILESGFGRSELALKTNNHFGIKCHRGWTGAYDFHDDDEKGECFRKYNHPMYSFRDHSIFLSSRARYAFLFNLRRDDYKRWAKGLREAGYATDKRYPQKLISFIEQYQLYRYDNEVLKEGYAVQRQPKDYGLTTYIVKKGDTLYSISRRYFVSVSELRKLNNMDDNLLSIGQRLVIKSEKIKK
ncbi:glucosaminidase domain-containing protein [Spongiimicrobium sp. 2-473A-2-J]|uniref:glucosaminidase domain-containing protein n=1 Tax=Eudoraea algarum TaxID=3417568 RepID=UPI003D36BD3C